MFDILKNMKVQGEVMEVQEEPLCIFAKAHMF